MSTPESDPVDILDALARDFDSPSSPTHALIRDVVAHQRAKGLAKYGSPLTTATEIDGLRYLLEELVDAMAYAKWLDAHCGFRESGVTSDLRTLLWLAARGRTAVADYEVES